MRYQNWDVLLFAGTSRIPLQEFKTGCHVLQDPGISHLADVVPTVIHLTPHTESAQLQTDLFPSQICLPTLTTFIPSLPPTTSFRVSIHSWIPPSPSTGLLAIDPSTPKNVLFEARVLLDGRCVALALFPSQGPWPQIIDWATFQSDTGVKSLLFPAFRNEILSQHWWSAAESIGRIQVIISEGVRRDVRDPPFVRFRNIATFSFQHAPIDILEACGIAYPNPSMWAQVSGNALVMGQLSPRRTQGCADDHAHSPSPTQHHQGLPSNSERDSISPSRPRIEAQQPQKEQHLPPSAPIPFKLRSMADSAGGSDRACRHNQSTREFDRSDRSDGCGGYSQPMSVDGGSFTGTTDDPFVSASANCCIVSPTSRHNPVFGGGFNIEDQPMPDYSNPASSSSHPVSASATTASSRSATGFLHRYNNTRVKDKKIYDELILALTSPRKDNGYSSSSVSGTFPPANTRTSSADSTPHHRAAAPPPPPPPSAAAKARTASYAAQVEKQRKPSTSSLLAAQVTTGKMIKGLRVTSDASMTSKFSEEEANKENDEPPLASEKTALHPAPTLSIKGKKEGTEAERGSPAPGRSRSVSTTLMVKLRQESGRLPSATAAEKASPADAGKVAETRPHHQPPHRRTSSASVPGSTRVTSAVPKRKRSLRDASQPSASGSVDAENAAPKGVAKSSPARKLSRYVVQDGSSEQNEEARKDGVDKILEGEGAQVMRDRLVLGEMATPGV